MKKTIHVSFSTVQQTQIKISLLKKNSIRLLKYVSRNMVSNSNPSVVGRRVILPFCEMHITVGFILYSHDHHTSQYLEQLSSATVA